MEQQSSNGTPEEHEPLTAAAAINALSEAFKKTGPEAAEHLAVAGRELAEAVRSFVRGFAEALTEARPVESDDEADSTE